MKNFVFLCMSLFVLFLTTQAFADGTIAIMKLDVTDAKVESQAAMLVDALRTEAMNADLRLDGSGSDISYTEMQMLTGCDRDANIACYEAACEMLAAPAIIFGSMRGDGMAKLVWYVSGKGIFRELNEEVLTKEDAIAVAKQMVIGEMGSLVVTCNIDGADVFIDGKRVGASSSDIEFAMPIDLLTGNYIVAVRKDGYVREDAVKVTITAGKREVLNVTLTPAVDENKVKDAMKYAGLGTLGVGAAVLVASAVMSGILAHDNKVMKNGILDTVNTGDPVDISSNILIGGDDDVRKLNEKGKTMATVTTALWVTGGVLAGAGIAMTCVAYFYDFGLEESYAAGLPKVDFALSPDYKGLSLGWTF